ncbi:16S rRNA processing protein RimM [candidate division KSB1 bacterium]|nr:16S rRNA processing protein RimM [candidate division KSB1 bacterium]
MSAGRQRPDYIIIGRIIKPHGVKGALKVEPLTDDAHRFELLNRVFIGSEDKPDQAVVIENIDFQHHNIILSFRGVASRDEAEKLRNCYLYLPADEAMSLPAGDIYIFDLLGLDVYAGDGAFVGTVKDYQDFPAGGMFVIEKERQEFLLPDVPEIVREIDLDAGKIIVTLIDGLLD